MARWPLAASCVQLYLLFVVASLLSAVLGLEQTWAFIVVWPYPFLLALQRWINAGNLWLRYGFGLLVVGGASALCQRLAGSGRPNRLAAWLLAVLVTFGSLSVVQWSTQGYASSQGWPTGE